LNSWLGISVCNQIIYDRCAALDQDRSNQKIMAWEKQERNLEGGGGKLASRWKGASGWTLGRWEFWRAECEKIATDADAEDQSDYEYYATQCAACLRGVKFKKMPN
jgi:hypothetical protein